MDMMKTKPVELNRSALGTSESLIMGIAGTAPAFSLAATISTLIAAVGVLSPASLLYSSVVIFGVTLAFVHLTRINASAGGAFTWVGDIFHPALGFLCGWSLLFSSAIFMVSGSMPAATATLALFAPDKVASPVWVTALAALWLVFVGAIVVKGIKATSYTQIIFTVVELGALIAILVAGWFKPGLNVQHPLTSAQFSLAAFTPSVFVAGALISLFFFWGWDVAINLNEETQDAESTARPALFGAMLVTLLLYMGFTMTTLHVLSDQEISDAGTNVVYVLAEHLFPKPWSYMALVAVTLSTVGNLETSILQFTRTLFAKSRSGVLPVSFARLHPHWQTPWVATLLIVVLGLVFLFAASFFPTVKIIVADSVNAIGFMVCFYYSLAALACVWYFRKQINSFRDRLELQIWPGVSGLFLVFIGIRSLPTFDTMTLSLALGGMAAGWLLWVLRQRWLAID